MSQPSVQADRRTTASPIARAFALAVLALGCATSAVEAFAQSMKAAVGVYRKYTEIAGAPLHGIYLIPSDLPSTIASSMPTIRGLNQEGLVVSDADVSLLDFADDADSACRLLIKKTSR